MFDFINFRPIFVTYKMKNMKHLARFLSLILLVGAGIFLSNCGSDGGGKKESEKEKQFKKLKGEWTVFAVETTAPGATDWDAEFAGGVLRLDLDNFTEDGPYLYTFAVPGGVPTSPWPGEGSWEFSSSNPSNNIIRRDSQYFYDNLNMTYQLSNNDQTLEITFQLDPDVSFVIPDNGKVASVEGIWTFTFMKP